MGWFHRRDPRPAIAALEAGERIVSWADTDGDEVVAATPLGLWWPGPRRIAWHRIDKAVWRDGVLSIVEADVVDDVLLVDRPAVSAWLLTPRDLPPTVRKRVEANIVRTEVLSVPGGSVRFVGRRQPGHDGVAWFGHLEDTTPDTPELRSAIAARIAILQAS